MAKDLVELILQAAILNIDDLMVTHIMKFARRRNLLIGASDETYQHVLISKTA